MSLVPAGVAVVVTAYCLGCVVRPSWRDPGSGSDVAVGHVAMGSTMLVMSVGVLSAAWTPALLAVIAAAVVGCAVRGATAAVTRTAYLRLGVLFAAMLPMLTPAAAMAAPGTSASTTAALAAAAQPGHPMSMAGTDAAVWSVSPAGRAVDLLLIAALLALTAARLAEWSRPGLTLHCRLHTIGDVGMAATTGCMLAAML